MTTQLIISDDRKNVALLLDGKVVDGCDMKWIDFCGDVMAMPSADCLQSGPAHESYVNGIEECGRALEGNGSYSRAADLFWEAYGRVDPSAVDAADTINSLQGMANAVSSLIVNHCQQQVAATVFVTTYDLLTGVVEFSDACECPVEQMVHFDIAQ